MLQYNKNPLAFTRMLKSIASLIATFIFYTPSLAQGCDEVLKRGIFNTTTVEQSDDFKQKLNEYIFDSEFSTHEQAMNAGFSLGAIVFGVPLKLGGTFSKEQRDTWRREHTQYKNSRTTSSSKYSMLMSNISTGVLDAWLACHNSVPRVGLVGRLESAGGGSSAILSISWMRMAGDTGTDPIVTASSITGGSRIDNTIGVLPVGYQLVAGIDANVVQITRAPSKTCVVVVSTTRVDISCILKPMPKPTIIFFTANPINITSGSGSNLRWGVEGADVVTINDGIGNVSPASTRNVAPVSSKTYTLTASNSAGSLSESVTINVAPPPAVLTGGNVFFRTTDDDKDHDTNVAVYVKSGGNSVAQWSGSEGHWDDNSDHGPYNLTVISPILKSELIGAGQAVLIESPNGSDEWHFNWRVILTFSDNTQKQFDWGDGNVDSDRNTITKPLP